MAFVAQQINMQVGHPTILDVTCDVTAKKMRKGAKLAPGGFWPLTLLLNIRANNIASGSQRRVLLYDMFSVFSTNYTPYRHTQMQKDNNIIQ